MDTGFPFSIPAPSVRCVVLWSNEGEIVFTPFMGVGSEVYGAVINGRRGIGFELKPSYFNQAVKNLIPPYEHAENDELDLDLKIEGEQWPDIEGEEELE